jgi:hypothetical protein
MAAKRSADRTGERAALAQNLTVRAIKRSMRRGQSWTTSTTVPAYRAGLVVTTGIRALLATAAACSADRPAGHQLGQVVGQRRAAYRGRAQAQRRYGDGRAAVNGRRQQPGQLPAVVLGAFAGQPDDQSQVVQDVAAHAAAAAR